MPSGVGNVFILPGARDIWSNLTGGLPGVGNQGWFGPNPMQNVGAAMNVGQRGGFVSRGPQSMTWTPPTDQNSWNAINTPAGINAALFGNSFQPGAGQGAYGRFMDSGSSYLRRYGTDVRVDPRNPNVALQPELDAHGNPVGFGQGVSPNPAYYDPNSKTLIESPERSAGQRSGALFGGRGPNGEPIGGVQSDINKTFLGLAQLQQGANPYLNDPRMAAQMAAQSELDSPFARATPGQYLNTALGVENQGPSTGQIGNSYIPQMGGMTGGMYSGVTGQVAGLQNQYEKSLLDQMSQQGSKDLSLGLQDAQGTLAAMGLSRSGQGQSTAGGVWRDIQEKNALDRQNLMAQFAEANAARNQQTMLGMGTAAMDANSRAILAAQQGAIGGAESRFGRLNQAAMMGQQANTASLEASRQAQRAAMLGGQEGTRQWNLGLQGNALQSMLGSDQAMLNRLNAESAGQSLGLHDYTGLQQLKDQMYDQRLSQMLDLEDRYRTSQNEVLNQQMQFGMMPANWMMQMITGINPGAGTPARTNPWPTMLANAGLQYGGNLLGQMGQPAQSSYNQGIYGAGQNSLF